MLKFPGFAKAAALVLLAAAAPLCFAVDTHIWEQSDQADFARGNPKNVSIRSDGRVTLAPEFKELDSTNVPYLWAIAEDSKGAVYYAGGAPTGATTRIFVLPRNGKPKSFAELTGLEVHALAVDSQDRIYAAVLPDAKIYRIGHDGKPQLFFDAKCKYIWSLAFDHAGNLFVATGDSGIIYRVTPDGNGSVFFRTEETHARSMIIDSAGNLIVGTEPGGLVIRVSPSGEGFVLYQTNKREVTAVAEHDGIIYASSVGSKPQSVSVSGPAPVLPSSPAPVSPTGAPHTTPTPPTLPPAIGSLSASVTGGSELYRIQKDGSAQKIWSNGSDIVYAISFDFAGHPILGTGNKGIVYRIDSDQLSTQLLNAPPTQVTAFLQGHDGVIYAATGNVGTVYSIGPGLSPRGTLESEVYDASSFVYWGKVHITPTPASGAVSIETRSGNLSNPETEWSPWSKVAIGELGGAIASPPARFIQYRLTLNKSESGESPLVAAVDLPYLPKNLAPEVHLIEIAPFNYRQAPSSSSLEAATLPSGSPRTLSLPAVGQHRTATGAPSLEGAASATLQYSKGFVTARWSASDPNEDPLSFKVEIRGKSDSTWRVLKDKLYDRYYAFDSSAFPDGSYLIRVTASDAPGNTPAETLSSSLESEPFIIDNTPPEITALKATGRQVSFTAKDALSWIDKAEYSLNGNEWILLNPVEKVTDSQTLEYSFEVPSGQIVAVRVFDEEDNVAVRQIAVP